MIEAVVIAFTVVLGSAIFGFLRPRGAFRAGGIAVLAALALPFVLGFLLSPFVSDAAGLGVSLILIALSALTAASGIATGLGACTRYAWNALAAR